MTMTATILRSATIAAIAMIAVPLAAQAQPAPAGEGQLRESAAMVAPVKGRAALAQARGAGEGAMAMVVAPVASPVRTQSFTLPGQAFDLSAGIKAKPELANEPTYRVPPSDVLVDEAAVSLEEAYMPGLSGDLEEFRPRQSVTFRF